MVPPQAGGPALRMTTDLLPAPVQALQVVRPLSIRTAAAQPFTLDGYSPALHGPAVQSATFAAHGCEWGVTLRSVWADVIQVHMLVVSLELLSAPPGGLRYGLPDAVLLCFRLNSAQRTFSLALLPRC